MYPLTHFALVELEIILTTSIVVSSRDVQEALENFEGPRWEFLSLDESYSIGSISNSSNFKMKETIFVSFDLIEMVLQHENEIQQQKINNIL